MFAIQLKNIDKSFGKKKVLNNLSLQIRENEMVALIGPSGCGKTTLLKTKQEKHALINEALNKVGLSEYNELKIFEISGGEQQRVALARAMIKPSKIILADEPTGALDSKNRDEVLQLLREINKQRKTIVIVTHDMTVANSCDRIIQL